jgi:hypothetical protein
MTDGWWIAIVSNAVVLLSALWATSIRATAKLGTIEADIISVINKHAFEDVGEFAKIRQEIYGSAHDFGETISSLKQKINDVELYGSNNYVRREGLVSLTDSITALRSELRADLLRMEQKIDLKT